MSVTRMTGRSVPTGGGAAVAAVTAAVSGVSICVNSYGVHAVPSPAVYTTAKNMVAAVLLTLLAAAVATVGRRRGSPVGDGPRVTVVPSPYRWLGLAYVGVVGGGLAFVLFFDGLAATAAAPAAFWRDTLVIWVAVLAVPLLGERVRWWNAAAIGVLVAGQIVLAGGTGHLTLGRGEMLVLASSVLWALEAVVVKALLADVPAATVGVVRMGVGSAALVVYLAARGQVQQLTTLDAGQLGWVLLTGVLLAVYVSTWMAALARGRAVDVTSVLVGSALITWSLQAAAGNTVVSARDLGLVLVAAGAAAVLWGSGRRAGVGRARTGRFGAVRP